MKLKILYLITEDWFFCSHFIERAVAARNAGYEVVVVAREQFHGDRIRSAGLRLIPVDFVRRRVNPLGELRLLFDIWRIYRSERPDLVHQIAAKPILYGSFVSLFLSGVRVVNAPVGMGYVFSSADRAARLLRPLLRLGYKLLMNPRESRVVFENSDDLTAFVNSGSVGRADAVLIRGAGIDLRRYRPTFEPDGLPVVVLVARMLRDKGICEFVAAAKILNEKNVVARFLLVGDPDPENPASIAAETLRAWHGKHGVEWCGWCADTAAVLNKAHVACLPSYREGLPKSLLEAAACGLPIVTTDTPGCREVVSNGDNGFLVPVYDVQALAVALKRLIDDPALRRRMGLRSRKLAESEFSSERVIGNTLSTYTQLLLPRGTEVAVKCN